MSYNKYIEIYCDECMQAYQSVHGNIKYANKEYEKVGGIYKSNGTHYCSTECYEKGYFKS